MARVQEARLEERQAKMYTDAGKALDYGLRDAVAHAGGILTGFTVKISEYECFMTLKADMPAGKMIAFVGADTLPGVFLKAVREAKGDRLRWKKDQYARG